MDVEAERTEAVFDGVRFIARDPLVRSITSAQALSQGSFQSLVLALPVLAFVAYRSPTVAGLLEGAWGAGALVGSIMSIPLTRRRQPLRLAPVAWAAQSIPLWLLVLHLPVAVLATALAVSGIGNGIRNPPTTALVLARVPARLRPQVLAAASAAATLGGLVTLIATGPSLQNLGIRRSR